MLVRADLRRAERGASFPPEISENFDPLRSRRRAAFLIDGARGRD
jgi:hypothetical protein